MKTTVLLLAGIAMFQIASAQNEVKKAVAGTVKYEETIKLEIHLEGDGAQFANMLPKERKSNKILIFNQDAALYTSDKAAAEDENMALEGEGGMMHIRMMEPDNKMFTDLKNKKQLEQREFMTRMFLIESQMGTSPWKLTGNEKVILGFTCQEAVMEKDSVKTVAWFTPTIPVSAGPSTYNNLPGLVLQVDVKDGNRVITATSVDQDVLDVARLVKPKEGKKVTEAEFREIVDEKMKEMGVENGQVGHAEGATMMIRIQK
ncbi:MAG: hypothetical protein A2X22_01760 [Bacteroidetes bacterium GWF2_49_14]|nr:MAG: hypothetical protein A2X22_01760 [Bacteroidetes bacterium GWF2_49_14]HBB93419.1 hypothetical protein [Bacteroidales bacterium]